MWGFNNIVSQVKLNNPAKIRIGGPKYSRSITEIKRLKKSKYKCSNKFTK